MLTIAVFRFLFAITVDIATIAAAQNHIFACVCVAVKGGAVFCVREINTQIQQVVSRLHGYCVEILFFRNSTFVYLAAHVLDILSEMCVVSPAFIIMAAEAEFPILFLNRVVVVYELNSRRTVLAFYVAQRG